MTDTRPAGLGTGREYDFPEMRARFGTPTPQPVELPTEPGLYVVRGARGDDWAAELAVLDTEGFWSHLDRRDATADEIRALAGTHPLERLIRRTEADQ